MSIEFLFRALVTDSDGRVTTIHDRDKIAIQAGSTESALFGVLHQVPLAFTLETARRVAHITAGLENPPGPAPDPAGTAPRTGS